MNTIGMPDTISRELRAAAADSADATVLEYGGYRLSYAGLHDQVQAAARGLIAAGVAPGDRIAVWAPNTIEAAIALLAIPVAGATVVPLNTRYRQAEAADIIQRAGCSLVLAPARFLDRNYAAEALAIDGPGAVVSLGQDVEAGTTGWHDLVASGTPAADAELSAREEAQAGGDVVLIQYTSGTTGRPKGAALRQGPMLATARTWTSVAGLSRGDTGLVTYPLAHIGGFKTGLLTTIVARAAAAMFPVVDADSLIAATAQYRPAVLAAPPPVLRTLLDAVRDGLLPAERLIGTVVTGSSIVPPALIQDLTATLVADVVNAYGLTEATGVCTMTRRGDPVALVSETIGRAINGVDVRIAPGADQARDGGKLVVGEIEVRGPNVMVGYLDDPAATAEVMDGDWLRTGDVGWIDADGYVRIAGRARDMVIVGGFNVYPAEVEHVLAEHPAVAEAAVVGVPDDRLGEVVAAFVVPASGPPPNTAELTGWCRERVANFKVPRHLWMVPSLPRANAGKVAKSELRATALRLTRGDDPPKPPAPRSLSG
jgi:acyl-CoA synthetase (AMP-forming)/AMP-acid ligase II